MKLLQYNAPCYNDDSYTYYDDNWPYGYLLSSEWWHLCVVVPLSVSSAEFPIDAPRKHPRLEEL